MIEDKTLMGIFGLLVAIIMYINVKYNKKEMSGFTLIRAWGVIVTGIMIAVICFIKILFGLD